MVTFLKNVHASSVPEGLYDFLPLQASLAYNVKESADGFVFDVVVAPRGTPEAALRRQAKFQLLQDLTTEVDGLVFDSNPSSRTSILTAMLTLPEDSSEVLWKLADNSWESCTKDMLQQVLLKSQLQIQEIIGAGASSAE